MPSFMIVRLQTSEIKREQTDKQTNKHTDNVIYIYRLQWNPDSTNSMGPMQNVCVKRNSNNQTCSIDFKSPAFKREGRGAGCTLEYRIRVSME